MGWVTILATILLPALLVAVGILAWVTAHRSRQDVERIGEAANQLGKNEYELNLMTETIKVLRENLADAKDEAEGLREDLSGATKQMTRLQYQISVANANVMILTQHILQHVPPSVPFPRLREVAANGN